VLLTLAGALTTPSFRRGGDTLLSVIPYEEGNTSAGRALIGRLRERLAGVPGGWYRLR
jgi:RND superfamily putative drug exporter